MEVNKNNITEMKGVLGNEEKNKQWWRGKERK